jgi:tripartite-type tricarboxylate transporter receptor subunit TctC
MPYDTVKDFAPVTEIGSVPMMLVVNSKVQAKTVAELIALAKAAPGTFNYASAGAGTSLHLAAVLFSSMAHIDVVHIPYKGTTPGLQDLLGGRVQFMFPTVVSVAPQLKGGQVRALGVTSASRVPGLPDVPAIAETPGMAGYESAIWYGVLAPAHTPPEVIAKLNAEFHKALADPDTSARLAAQGVVIKTGTPAQFGAKINVELERWGKVIRQNGIRLD